MLTRERIAAIVAVAGLCGVAMAQDSVGRTASGSGTAAVKDNLSPYNGSQFQATFVLDLVPFQSSWGNTFRIGPVIKTSNASNGSPVTSAFANANALSSTQKTVFFSENGLEASYWSNTGVQNNQGVNSTALANGPTNDAPGTLNLLGATRQLSVAVVERNSSGATGNASYGGIVGAVMRHAQGDSGRFFVTRVNGLTSNAAAGSSTASLGLGAVDSDGNVVARVDGFGMDGTNPRTIGPVTGQSDNNYVRFNLLARDTNPNWARWTRLGAGTLTDLVDTGAPLCSQTGVDVLRDAAAVRPSPPVATGGLVNANCPNLIPEQVAGRPITIGSCFDGGFRYESAAGVVSESTAHLNALNTDHRGNANYTFRNFFPNSVNGTGAFFGFYVSPIGRQSSTNALGTGGDALSISAFGLGANGAPTGEYLFVMPDAAQGLGMTDPYGLNPTTNAPFNTATDYPLPPLAVLPQFQHYQGSTFSNGGSGPVAIGVLPDGQLQVGAAVSAQASPGADPSRTDRRNYIAIGRTASTSGPTEWVVAAWVNAPLNGAVTDTTGKAIEDGNGNVVGRLTTMGDVVPTAQTTDATGGPSLSDPAFDSVGNIYFIGAVRLNTPAGEVKRFALIRGVRQESPFGFKLEKVVAERDEFVGLNSGGKYRISGLNLSTAGGIVNGTLWSNATNQETVDGADRAALQTRDAASLGGIILSASITYDENNNGSYADATDQNYQAVLFINGAAPACRADFNGDGDINPDDLGDFITCYFTEPPCAQADFNGDNDVNPDDLGDFITVYFSGGCG